VTVLEWLQAVSNTVFLLVSLAAIALWWRRRSATTAWVAGTFVLFALIILSSILGPEATEQPRWYRTVLILALLGSPYPLYRFADNLIRAPRWARRAADVFLVGLVVATPFIQIPDRSEPWSTTVTVFVVYALTGWLFLFGGAGWLLARGARGQAGVVRNRLRMLAVGAILLGIAIPLGVVLNSDQTGDEQGSGAVAETEDVEEPVTAGRVFTSSLSTLAGLLFFAGFVTPRFLRASWRHRDERELYEAAVDFMGAERPDDVARVLVPRIRTLLGAPAAILYSSTGEVLARDAEDDAPTDLSAYADVQIVELGGRRLEVALSPTMPLFGSDENELLSRLSVLAELALDRTRLLEAEREAREDLRLVNEELESFVYTTSHDLKNPVIALLGYLEVINEDYAEQLPAEAKHYLSRMTTNARHMEALIRDLLELSRVGRVNVDAEHVDTNTLIDDLANDLARQYPEFSVERGDLPDLWLNGTRARQLFVNLLENAAKYGGRPDITVGIDSEKVGDLTRITVADDGAGIPDAYLDKVFGVFERLDPDATTGTGMGLAICRRIVETAGGEIRACPSEQGARIEIDLPAAALSGEASASRAEEMAL
jgi:signal transduction histidine kinase